MRLLYPMRLLDKELHMKSRRLKWGGHVAQMWETKMHIQFW